MKKNYLIFVLSAGICFLLQGCGKSIEDMDKMILEKDTSFRSVLDKRNDLKNEMELKRADFLKKDMEIEMEIGHLKKKREQLKREYTQKEEEGKLKLDPERRQLEKEIKILENEYKLKNVKLQDIERDIKEISSLMKKQEALFLTSEEIRTWNTRMSVLVKNKEEILTEVNESKKNIETMKMKIKVLRM
ncbi:MAG: hypothetical protein ABH862_03655 [Candidatus Omnitrophota bacterium]